MADRNSLPKDAKLLFIGGMHRSGTTMLWHLFRHHPEVSGFPPGTNDRKNEGQFEQSLYPIDQCLGRMDWPLHKDVHLTEASPLVTESNRAQLIREWGRHWDLQKAWLLEKTPRNMVMGRFLQALFPESRFLFITRHPVAQALALRRVKWSSRTVEELIERWLAAHAYMVEDCKSLRRFHICQYEDVVMRPQPFFDQLCKDMNLSTHSLQMSIDRSTNDKYHEIWRAELSRMAPGIPRVRSLELLNERVNTYGYDIFDWSKRRREDIVSTQVEYVSVA